MQSVTTIGLDLAKDVFQLHGVDGVGQVVFRERRTRAKLLKFLSQHAPCTVIMEACATAHYWARQIAELGHEALLIPPTHVKPYVRRQKNDAADAEAIVEASKRAGTHFVPVKSEEQQARCMVLRSRSLLVQQRTQLSNALRAHFAELGFIFPKGKTLQQRLDRLLEEQADTLPIVFKELAGLMLDQLKALSARIVELEQQILQAARQSQTAKRLMTIPGIGPICASSMEALAPPMEGFAKGRDFSAWLGLVPRQHSSGGKERLGKITKMGQSDLRRLLVAGAMAVLRHAMNNKNHPNGWLVSLLQRKPTKLVAVALANKMARTIWALMTKQETYRLSAQPA